MNQILKHIPQTSVQNQLETTNWSVLMKWEHKTVQNIFTTSENLGQQELENLRLTVLKLRASTAKSPRWPQIKADEFRWCWTHIKSSQVAFKVQWYPQTYQKLTTSRLWTRLRNCFYHSGHIVLSVECIHTAVFVKTMYELHDACW